MDNMQSDEWSKWKPRLEGAFPRASLPDIPPRGALAGSLVSRIAAKHDLTVPEVREIIDDVVIHRIATGQAVSGDPDGIAGGRRA
jgi:hypothetical protein